ncbi:MAG: DedA family protein [Balneolales bacterium]|nr:DedA family protein [Balneolales bacterium]
MIEEYLLNLVEWIAEQPLIGVYLILLFISYLENVVPPIPGDLLIVFGGYLIAEGIVGFSLVLLCTTVGSVMGFMTMYYFGFLLGDEIRTQKERIWILRLFDANYLNKAERWMYRWGQGVIVANRFLAGARSIISIIAGVTRLNIKKTVLFATIGAGFWNILLISAGWYIGDNWPVIQNYLNYYGWVIASLLVLYVICVSVKYLMGNKKES